MNTIGNNFQTSQLIASQASSASSGTVLDQLALKMWKDTQEAEADLVQKLIVDTPQPTTPKSMNATFELKM